MPFAPDESQSRAATLETDTRQPTATPTSSKDIAEPTRQKARTQPSLWIAWWQELLFCATGLVSFFGIVVTLRLYDQEAPPQWPIDITLNSLLALLSTISKASFMISLAEVMGQWKWNMFSSSDGRPLHDFSLVDLASRGFWGSCWLVGRFRWRHPITIAGFISILSVLTSPITQQAIEYQTRSEGAHGRAVLGVSHGLPGIQSNMGVTPLDVAVQRGAYTSLQEPPMPLEPICTTANCTFPRYESLAVCVKTADVSAQLDVSTAPPNGHPEYVSEDPEADPEAVVYTMLPNNVTFDTPFAYAFRSQPGNRSLAFEEDEAYKTGLVNFFLTYTTAGARAGDRAANSTHPGQIEFRALEVLLYLCVNSYDTMVTEGQSHTKVTSSFSTVVIESDTDKPIIPKTQCLAPPSSGGGAGELHCHEDNIDGNITLSSNPASEEAGSASESAADNKKFTSEIFSLRQVSGSMVFSLYGQYERIGVSPRFTNMASLWLWDALYGSDGNITDRNEQLSRADRYYAGMAMSITNALRSIDSAHQLNGTAWQDEIFVNVRWGWLGFLAVELLTTILFVAFTIVMTRLSSIHVLKTSVLAVMLAPIKGIQEVVGTVENLDHAADVTKATQARFDNKILALVAEDDVCEDAESSTGVPANPSHDETQGTEAK